MKLLADTSIIIALNEEKLIIKNETEMMQDNSTIQEEVEHSCCRPKK